MTTTAIDFNKIESDLKLEFPDKRLGFKKCQDNKIVILELLGENNENRKDIINSECAKFRCSEAKVLKIFDMDEPLILYTEANGIQDNTFKYKLNETVKPKEIYTPEINKTCASGIHYYLTLKPAYFYDYTTPINGLYVNFYENGQLALEFNYINGKEDGLHKEFYVNGQLWIKCNYINGKKNGLYEKFHKNGQLLVKCEYLNGI